MNKAVLGIVLARGGSKGVPNKNALPVGGVSLVLRSALYGLGEACVHQVIVSSDSSDILSLVDGHAGIVQHSRSALTAGDNATSEAALREVIESAPEHADYPYVCLIEPTFPFRDPGLIDKMYAKSIANTWDSCVPTKPLTRNPKYIFAQTESGALEKYIQAPAETFTRRQDFSHLRRISAGLYLFRPENIFLGKLLQGALGSINDTSLYDINIDSFEDLEYAQFLADRFTDT